MAGRVLQLCATRWAVLSGAVVAFAVAEAGAQGVGPHLGGGVLAGDAAGLDDGYVHFGGFVPLAQPTDSVLFFADGSLLLYNESTESLGGNAGLGGRFFSDEFDRLFGGYVYYDRRDLGPWEVDQVGFGLESLGRVWDTRFNVNLPTSSGPGLAGVNASFAGNAIVLNGVEQHSLRVVEAEAGAVIKEWDAAQLKAFLGVYGLFDDSIDDVAGVRGRLSARVHDQLWVGTYVEHDEIFETTGGFTCEWRFGKGACACQESRSNPLARLGDPVVRRRYVAMSRTEYNDTPLTVGSAPVSVVHIDDDFGLGPASFSTFTASTGSAEYPFATLDEASGSTADVVYIHGGVYDNQTLVVTQDGQQVLGAGRTSFFTGAQGTFGITSLEPVIVRNALSYGVLVDADNVHIQGLTFDAAGGSTSSTPSVSPFSAGGFGVYSASGVQELVVVDNTFRNLPGGAIYLDGSSSGLIARNSMTDVHDGVYVEGDYAGDFRDNTIVRSLNGGLTVHGDMTGDVLRNRLDDAATAIQIDGDLNGDFGDNVIVNSNNGALLLGRVAGNVQRNTFTGNTTVSLQIVGGINGDFSENVAMDNGIGLTSFAGVSGDVTGNTILNHLSNGLSIFGEIGGNLADNTLAGNSANGAFISGVVRGDVVGNTASDNLGHGVFLGGGTEGSIADNTANDNSGSGVYAPGAVLGNVTGNTTNGSNSIGLFLGNETAGDISYNTADNNPGGGIYASGIVRGSVLWNSANGSFGPGVYLGNGTDGDVANNTTNNNSTGIFANGLVRGSVSGNTADGNNGHGVLLSDGAEGDLVANRGSGNSQSGIYSNGPILGDVAENLTNDNGGAGFVIDGEVGGRFANNTSNDNGSSGVLVFGRNNGDVTGNTASRNGFNGFLFDDDLERDFVGNTANNNVADGVMIFAHVRGGVFDNTANDNGDDGIDVEGVITGVASPNTTTSNGDVGFEN